MLPSSFLLPGRVRKQTLSALFPLSILLFLFLFAACGGEATKEEVAAADSSAGDTTTTTDNTTTATDTTAPTLAEVTAVSSPTNDNTSSYTFSSTEAGSIGFGGSCSSSTSIATTDNNTITFNALADGTYSNCTITVTDNATNQSSTMAVSSFTIDTNSPAVTSVSSSASNGSYKLTDNITVQVTFNENVIVDNSSGNPRIELETGSSDRYANYVSGNSTSVLSFLYSVQSGDNSSDLDYTFTSSLSANNGSIRDNASNNADLTLPAPGSSGSLGAGKDIVIDAIAPTVSSISPTDNQSGVSVSDNITVTFSEAMDNTSVTTNTDNTTCSGTLRVSSDNFSTCVQMSSSPSSSNSGKTFTVDPSSNLTFATTYKTRVTTGVKDTAGNTLGSQYETSTGFTTELGWAQEAYVKASNNDAGDRFGNSVALDGDTLAVGAQNEDSNQTTITNDNSTASSDNSNT